MVEVCLGGVIKIIVEIMVARKKIANFPISDVALSNFNRLKDNGLQSICFFNNKGGVGKTTLMANLAAQLSFSTGAKILLVDADPQCNLSQYLLSDDEFSEMYGSDGLVDSIYSIIHPLSIGKGYSDTLPVKRVERFGCDIIVGDPRLALKEDLLAQDWRDAKSGGTRGLRTTFVFLDLIKKAKDKYDFVFFDMGPSLGAINRAILMAVDNFLVPMSIDIFSVWAVRNIGEAVRVWHKELANGIKLAEDPSELGFSVGRKAIKFIGYVTQQHKEKSESGSRRVVEAYASIKNRLPNEVSKNLGWLYSTTKLNPHLGDVKHLASLAPKSQTLHTPMINVSLRGSYTITRKQAREIYSDIAERLLENIVAIA
ncbi:ParA family protein [Chromobacterium sp. LK11]|uniref:ParA family protein n=1 Tax=Chromobacterium sp. LK11 TaxID=1628212 RepID=UPI001E52DB39|nr:AAA family ATPase [Chromobacterium sp. LK11]